jgi:hypothetical protein
MIRRLLRFRDLKQRGYVDNWAQLKRLQERYGFPQGRMFSPNVRTWTDEELEEYYASRPVENERPLQGAVKAKHEARERREREAATDLEFLGSKSKKKGGCEPPLRLTKAGGTCNKNS